MFAYFLKIITVSYICFLPKITNENFKIYYPTFFIPIFKL